MRWLFEFLSSLNWLVLPETIVGTFWNADWYTARQRGFGGIISETFRSLLGTNSWPFFVPLNSGRNGKDIERLLSRYGIRTWGWGLAHGEMFFRVRRSQAAWAQHLLLKEGVPLSHALFAPDKAGHSSPGASRRSMSPDKAKDRASACSTSHLDSIEERFNAWVDRIDAHLK